MRKDTAPRISSAGVPQQTARLVLVHCPTRGKYAGTRGMLKLDDELSLHDGTLRVMRDADTKQPLRIANEIYGLWVAYESDLDIAMNMLRSYGFEIVGTGV